MPDTNSSSTTTPAYLSTRQVAKILGVHPDTVRRWRRDKVGPLYLRVGKVIRYAPTSISASLGGQNA